MIGLKSGKTDPALADVTKSSIERGVSWLKAIRNPDNGWSYLEGHLSLAVETSEIILALIDLGFDSKAYPLREAIDFVKASVKDRTQIVLKSPRNRGWVIWMLSTVGEHDDLHEIKILLDGLSVFAEKGSGWSIETGGRSNTYDTSIMIRAFSRMKGGKPQNEVEWLKRIQNPDGGWGFHGGEPSTPLATAHALSALLVAGERQDSKVTLNARTRLQKEQKKDGSWINSWEELPYLSAEGNPHKYFHFATPWVVMALNDAGVSLKTQPLLEACEALVKLQTDIGAWKAEENVPLMTFLTANALSALSRFVRLD